MENVPKTLTLVTVGDKPNVELGFDQVIELIKAASEGADTFKAIMDNEGLDLGDIQDLPKVYSLFRTLQGLWENKELLLAQLEGIDFDEAQELIEQVSLEFEITTEDAKEQIENVIFAAYYVYRSLTSFGVV